MGRILTHLEDGIAIRIQNDQLRRRRHSHPDVGRFDSVENCRWGEQVKIFEGSLTSAQHSLRVTMLNTAQHPKSHQTAKTTFRDDDSLIVEFLKSRVTSN